MTPALRRWHRWVSTVLGAFLLVMAGTGALLQSQFLIHGFPPVGPPAGGEPMPAPNGNAPLSNISAKLDLALALAARRHPGAAVEAVTLAQRDSATLAVLQLRGIAGTMTLDVVTGREVPALTPAPPPTGPIDQWLHQVAFGIHTGQLFHLPGEVMTLLCGLSLLFLAGSGLWLLVRMYLQRSRAGKAGLFWS
jgi:uncharacterized iron-regulated membrane protein